MLAPLIWQVTHDDSVWPQSAARAVEAGFAGIELSIRLLWHGDAAEPDLTAESLTSALNPGQPRILSLRAEPGDPQSSLGDEPTIVERLIRRTTTVLDAATHLKADAVVLNPFEFIRRSSTSAEIDHDLTIRIAIEAFSELRFEAQRRAIRIVIDPDVSGFLDSPSEGRTVIDRINSPRVGLAISANASGGTAATERIRALGRRVFHVYVSACHEENGEATNAGAVSQLADALRSARFEGLIVARSDSDPRQSYQLLSSALS